MERARIVLRSLLFLIKNYLAIYILFINGSSVKAQTVNFIGNGSFEEIIDCSLPPHLFKAKYWRSIDSLTWTPLLFSSCTGIANVPSNPSGYQKPHSGNSYGASTLFCDSVSTCTANNFRAYFRNRLKHPLDSGHKYCVKCYLNVVDASTYGSDGVGLFFGDDNIDTITVTGVALNYINPQISNTAGHILSDTMNWVLISGTFTATGEEKHAIIGSFKPNLTNSVTLINPSLLPSVFTDIYLDDVSCIDVDLPAYAGPDTYIVLGGSVYIGRDRDVGIDEACIWYKLPNATTSIDTAAGIWVSPTTTSTYMVVQDICGNIKRDTVVVSLSGVGLNELEAIENDISIFPNPASDYLQFQYTLDVSYLINRFVIYNSLGQIMREDAIEFRNKKARIQINDLSNGVYSIELKNSSGQVIKRRFVVAR